MLSYVQINHVIVTGYNIYRSESFKIRVVKMTLLHMLFALVAPYIVLSLPNTDIHVHLHLGPQGHNKSKSRTGETPGAGRRDAVQFQGGYLFLHIYYI